MEMRKKLLVPIIVGVVLLVVIIVAFLAFRLNNQYLVRSTPTSDIVVEQGDVQTRFLENGTDTATPDSLQLSRIVRGYIDSTNLSGDSSLVLSTQLNWPDQEPQRPIPFRVTENTEYLCWSEGFQPEGGPYATYQETVFLLDDNHKLSEANQKPLTVQEAEEALQKGTPVILALQKGYVNSQVNNIFQIAIIGCQ